MVIKADQERIKTLLKDTITLLCKNGLNFKTEFSVEALIGITLDKEDVVLVSINEIIRSELGAQLALANKVKSTGGDLVHTTDEEESDVESAPSTPASTNSRRYRKRKHSPVQFQPQPVQTDSDNQNEPYNDYELEAASFPGDDSNSEPPNKRLPNSNNAKVLPKRFNDTKDIILIKEEIDTGDWPGGPQSHESFSDVNIPPGGGMAEQHSDNFDFLHSGALVPMTTASSSHPSWSDSGQPTVSSMNISPSKRSATVTGIGQSPHGDNSQQRPPNHVQFRSSPNKKVRTCSACGKTLSTLTGYNQHIKHHMGIYKHVCSQCGKAFTAKVGLENHMRKEHQGQKLVCDKCGTSFVSYQGYLWHKAKAKH